MIRPTDDNVLVRLLRPRDTTSSGLVAVPVTRKPGLTAVPAVVEAVGPGALALRERLFPSRPQHPVDSSPRVYAGERIPPSVAVGEYVLLDTNLAGQPWQGDDGEPRRIVREAEIIATLEGATEDEARAYL